ncbi:MAG: hypothetical protein JW860_07155 [Sedimentisphaerales bacterium]|nr:hypothetical protein [Sedimentisphaerales bacterium]
MNNKEKGTVTLVNVTERIGLLILSVTWSLPIPNPAGGGLEAATRLEHAYAAQKHATRQF